MSLAHLYFIHFVITLFSIVLSFKANVLSRNLTAFYLFFFLLASRQFEYKQDLLSYYNWATWNFYTYREPVFSYINSLTYNILSWRNIYFLSDTIAVLIIRDIFQRLNLNHSYMLILFCFFPVIMGFQSIYRQFFGSLICLYILSFAYHDVVVRNNNYFKRMRRLIYALIAIGSHNIHFLSVLVINSIYLKYFLNFFFSIIIGFIIVYFYDFLGKSNQNTGDSTAIFYLLTLLILFFCFYLNKDKIGLNISISGFIVIAIMWSNNLETPSERVGLNFLILLFISLVYYVDRFKPLILSRLILLFLSFVPLFLSSAQSLLTESYLR